MYRNLYNFLESEGNQLSIINYQLSVRFWSSMIKRFRYLIVCYLLIIGNCLLIRFWSSMIKRFRYLIGNQLSIINYQLSVRFWSSMIKRFRYLIVCYLLIIGNCLLIRFWSSMIKRFRYLIVCYLLIIGNCLLIRFWSSMIKRFRYLIVCYLFIIGNCLLIIDNCSAQKPIGKFLEDSIEIGKPLKYVLSYRHASADDIFFPDTTYNYYPFELVNRTYLPTETSKNGSLDSVIYTLETFDIHATQKLALPIYTLTQRDCTAVFSSLDSIFLKTTIKGDLNTIKLKTETNQAFLEPQIDYLRIISYLVGLLLITGIIYAFFGEFIRKQFNLFRFDRRHRDFLNTYKRITRGRLTAEKIGNALVLWKNHLESLEKIPYSSYTTKEIIDHLPNENLEDALKEVDVAIYGGVLSTQMPVSMNTLQTTATQRYEKRRKEIAEMQNH